MCWLKFRLIFKLGIEDPILYMQDYVVVVARFKYDLFLSDIITDVFVDLPGRTLPTFSWTVPCISNRGQFSLIFCTAVVFGEILELYYLETQYHKAQNICYRKQYRYSLRTVGHSLKEDNSTPPPSTLPILLICYHLIFLYHKYLYTYYPSCSLSDLCLYDTGENFIKLVFNPIVYIWQ